MAAAVAQERLVEVEADEAVVERVVPVGEEKTFRAYDPDQVLLMAPVLSEWIPEGDLAHFVSDLVESGTLDLSAIYDSYEEERGFPPYDPRLMVKLLVYGYANGVMSSRKLERATYGDVAVRMLCADQHPDYRSIARFRKRHLEALGELFVQALRLCKQAKLVGLGSLALDGTKLRANASRHKAMSYERMSPRSSSSKLRSPRSAATLMRCCPRPSGLMRRRMSASGPTVAAMSCPRSCSVVRRGWRRSARPRRRSRPRPARRRPHGAPSLRRRASSRARRATGATRSRPSPRRSGTSPTRSRRS